MIFGLRPSRSESIPANKGPQHGTATIRANHTILYVPNANYYGTDTFTVAITDETSAALSTSALVTIVVSPVNDQPEIKDLTYYQTTQGALDRLSAPEARDEAMMALGWRKR